MSYYELAVLVVICCWGPLLNVHFYPGSQRRRTLCAWRNQRCSNYGYNTRHGPFNTYAKCHCSKLGHAVVMNTGNLDIWQRQKYLTSVLSCYFKSLLDKVSYLLESIMLLLEIIATMISTVKFERNNLPFTIEDILKGEFNWNMYEITPPCYVINIYIYIYRIYSKQHGFLNEELTGYTHANFYYATTFGCRNIAFQIWWLPCNSHKSEWPKSFFGRCILQLHVSSHCRFVCPIARLLLTCKALKC